ncbi:MAG: STAS domain-containing protein [Planctomycetota bacterium]
MNNNTSHSESRKSGRHTTSHDYLAIARSADLVIIRVTGLGNMRLAPTLADFAKEQFKIGFRRFVFDLNRCQGLDSTFMGVMVEICATAQSLDRGGVSVINSSPEVLHVLNMLGVDKFVKVCGACDLMQLETAMLPEKDISPDERHHMILRAHENLVEIDKRNEARFGSFLKTLSKELSQVFTAEGAEKNGTEI